MPVKAMLTTHDLPAHVDRVLEDFVAVARQICGDTLRSVVLYGSGAEGKLRATSDVNLVLTLTEFTPQIADALREPLRAGQAAARLAVMFLLESEVSTAVNAYPVKFLDIMHRHCVLYGSDPFSGLLVSRDASVFRLKQVLLNLRLRLRNLYVLHVPVAVYDLLRAACASASRPLTVILERDGSYPPIQELLAQLRAARNALAEGRALEPRHQGIA